MLSVVIPNYNYDVNALVQNIYNQCIEAAIIFEIWVYDDASTLEITYDLISDLHHVNILYGKKNVGLATARNILIDHTHYPHILMLDSDVMPCKRNFINQYLPYLTDKFEVVFGGIAYKKYFEKSESLRWHYGQLRETKMDISDENRWKFLCSNTLFRKEIFDIVTFDETIKSYGYEDLVFAKSLKKEQFLVEKIDNRVWHLKLENNAQFIQKTQQALANLHLLIVQKKLDFADTGITKKYATLKKWGLIGLLQLPLFQRGLMNKLVQNLLSEKPKMRAFDVYRLLYFIGIAHR